MGPRQGLKTSFLLKTSFFGDSYFPSRNGKRKQVHCLWTPFPLPRKKSCINPSFMIDDKNLYGYLWKRHRTGSAVTVSMSWTLLSNSTHVGNCSVSE